MRPGSAGRGELASLPGPVRADPAQRGPAPGPALSARLQEPAEPAGSGRELQPTFVQAARWVGTRTQNLPAGPNGTAGSHRVSVVLSRSDSALDPLVQVLEVLITSELNMTQAAPGNSA